MSGIIDFLHARLDDKEHAITRGIEESGASPEEAEQWQWVRDARADIAAKRDIIGICICYEYTEAEPMPRDVLKAMAKPFAEHPDYNPDLT